MDTQATEKSAEERARDCIEVSLRSHFAKDAERILAAMKDRTPAVTHDDITAAVLKYLYPRDDEGNMFDAELFAACVVSPYAYALVNSHEERGAPRGSTLQAGITLGLILAKILAKR